MIMKYELTKDLMSGNSTIDREHRELFDAVNRLFDACSAGKGRAELEPTAKFLLDYVDRHFAHEEELQKKSGYPEYSSHRLFHEGYKKKLREIAAQISAHGSNIADLGVLNAHIGVLVSHIRLEDKKLGGFLIEKGIR